jgi:arylsulfatase A-like enzyme
MYKNTPLLLSACLSTMTSLLAAENQKPNVVIIYVDDLGYADLGCYGAEGVETPNVDELAENGLRFTDAHCSAATSTPSRYSLLTGSYAFRNNAAVLPGDAPLLIDTNMQTLPGMLQSAGYKTAIVGKWHLGIGDGNVDWNNEVKPGPLEIGFDYSFIIPATGDRVPCVWLENHHVMNLDTNDPLRVGYQNKIGDDPTGLSHPNLLRYAADNQHAKTIVNGISRIGYMSGGHSARWTDEKFPHMMLLKARKFIKKNRSNPFFLFFSFHDIHVPRLPDYQFYGTSEMGYRGDAIVQMDWCTGQLVDYLEEMGLKENTLIIFSSDNGPVLDDGYSDQSEELIGGHEPSGPFRGGKYSAFEAGTRVPTIVYWPGVVEPGVSNALMTQVDILASLAALTKVSFNKKHAPDSYDHLDAWIGKSDKGRDIMVEESQTLAVRKNNWKYIKPVPLDGDMHHWIENTKNIESGLSHKPQLYNLEEDIGESNNLADQYPDKVKEMQNLLEEIENK